MVVAGHQVSRRASMVIPAAFRCRSSRCLCSRYWTTTSRTCPTVTPLGTHPFRPATRSRASFTPAMYAEQNTVGKSRFRRDLQPDLSSPQTAKLGSPSGRLITSFEVHCGGISDREQQRGQNDWQWFHCSPFALAGPRLVACAGAPLPEIIESRVGFRSLAASLDALKAGSCSKPSPALNRPHAVGPYRARPARHGDGRRRWPAGREENHPAPTHCRSLAAARPL